MERFSGGIAAAAMTGAGIQIRAPPNPEQNIAMPTNHTPGASAAAAVRPIAVIAVVAPEIAAVVIAVVHDGHVIDCILHVVSLVLRRPVGSCIR